MLKIEKKFFFNSKLKKILLNFSKVKFFDREISKINIEKKKKIIEKKEREALIAQIKEDQKRKSITAQKCRAEQKKLEQQYKELLWLVEQKERQVVKTRVNNSRSPRKTSGRRITSPKKRTPKHSSKLHQRAEWQS